jgi:hypothetical protein
MGIRLGAKRLLSGAVVSAAGLAALTAPGALASDPAGPAFVDQLESSLQPLRNADGSDVRDARDALLSVDHGRVLVDVYVDGAPGAAADALEAKGMQVVAIESDPLPVVEGWLPFDSLDGVAKLAATSTVAPALKGGTDVGAATSQGVASHNIPAAQATAGTTGSGVDVGVISDSINQVGGGVAGSQATGDLPANTQVLKDDPGQSDEGRAMAEIVFDEAPGLNSIKFASGTAAGAVDKADSIDQLTAAGVDVIADDIFFIDEPFFQDGVVSQAVDRAKAAGVAYFASAGNRARQSWEGNYISNGGSPDLNDFDTGPGVNTRNCYSTAMPTGDFMRVALQWDEPWGGATSDIDLRITNPGGTILAQSTSTNPTTGLPREIATFTNGGAPVIPCIEIRRFSGTTAPFMKWIEQDNYNEGVPAIDTKSNTINPDAASASGSLAVAAVAAADPGLDTPETFSSRGPNARLFDVNGNRLAAPEVRANPDLAAADGVNTTLPPGGLNPFFGTSAATPSAAGIATLLRSENPSATVNEIYAQMTNPANTIPCTTATPTQDCGAGFILADRAAANLDRTGPVITAKVKKKKKKKKHGPAKIKRITVTWSVTDPESPIESQSGCDPVSIKRGKRTLTCSATSGGGPSTQQVKVKVKKKKTKKHHHHHRAGALTAAG